MGCSRTRGLALVPQGLEPPDDGQWAIARKFGIRKADVVRLIFENSKMSYVLAASSSPSFVLKGLAGYEFRPLQDKDFAVHLLDVTKGHDTFMISRALTRIYYVIEGAGTFTIDGQTYHVVPGLIVEVPPGIEYSYSGSMRILLVSHPRWFPGNELMTHTNTDVVGESSALSVIAKRLRHHVHRVRQLVSL